MARRRTKFAARGANAREQRRPQSQSAQESAQVRHVVDLQTGVRHQQAGVDDKIQQREIPDAAPQPLQLNLRNRQQRRPQHHQQYPGQPEHRPRCSRAQHSAVVGQLWMDGDAQQIARHPGEQISRDDAKLAQQRLAQ